MCDVFRKSSCFNFRPSKQSSFYVFGVFVDSRGGGTPGSILTYFEKVRVLIFAHLNKSNQIRVRSMFLVVFVDSRGRGDQGGPL